MQTDNELTTLLRRSLTQATAELDPSPDLAGTVRRRYVRSRRRRIAVGVTVPAAALGAASGVALAGAGISNHTPSRSAVAVPSPAPATSSTTRPATGSATRPAAPSTPSASSAPVKPASYRVVLSDRSAPPTCPANATAPVGKSANPSGVWFWTDGQCVFVGVEFAHTKAANATPVEIQGYPGLYGTLENGVRTIYAPAAAVGWTGGWVALSMPVSASQEQVVHMILIPAN